MCISFFPLLCLKDVRVVFQWSMTLIIFDICGENTSKTTVEARAAEIGK